tara:strand:+ start:75116 stop:76228 length:1113 start_codon:yes stop_codon:yes gene_type:complete
MKIISNKFLLIIALLGLLTPAEVFAARIKDMTNIQGDRDNQLTGYGIVVGLAGTGDKDLRYTLAGISNVLKHFGLNIPIDKIKSKNAAAVLITADIGPFVKPGSRIDVTVSSLGEASTLQGGVLLQAPLRGADGVVYAVAQGPIAVGGFLGGGGGSGGSSVQQNHPTVGRISRGAIVEREIPGGVVHKGSINLSLINPDFTSAVRLADALNKVYPGSSQAKNSSTVNVQIPSQYFGQSANFLASIENIEVVPDGVARVVINERTGTIVATSNVRITRVAVSHGSLTITIASNVQASQPSAFSETGTTTEVENTQTTVDEASGGFQLIEDYPTIERLTRGLNALGVTTREMMSILQSLKSAGALQAELIIN